MTTTITVEGMTCGHCEQTVEEALEEVFGVTSVTVDRESEQASIDGEAEVTALVAAVEDAGYTAHA
ncbi:MULTISPECIES: heavy-metal-associated domain-containing protein [unclassified Halobacterium]|uniref:heavy-metal-associated domain-containing protein n=1 Tax=unclassified Halobacterium TaxID=2668073 RepID=UPI001E638348|nr:MULTISPECIES: heavy metal-associated domain-containing protein [unclassified Halobacterium]MCD2200708.1 heavy-metal-associated domain-containing protein [Halobacterium sp. KA-4]MCD2203976.1 heavy-metal-associated domain-containing protein [Halobacterium sp. KA-6]